MKGSWRPHLPTRLLRSALRKGSRGSKLPLLALSQIIAKILAPTKTAPSNSKGPSTSEETNLRVCFAWVLKPCRGTLKSTRAKSCLSKQDTSQNLASKGPGPSSSIFQTSKLSQVYNTRHVPKNRGPEGFSPALPKPFCALDRGAN